MNGRARTTLFVCSAMIAFAVLVFAATKLQPFGAFTGAYEQYLLHHATAQRHVYNTATAVNFDYRGFDTLGEEYIFFTSIAGLLFLVGDRPEAREHQPKPRGIAPERSSALRWFSAGLAGFIAAMAMDLAAHGQLTPGGGFQGGTVFGSAIACIYFGMGAHAFSRVAKQELFDSLEALGALAFAAVGVAAAFAGGYFLRNILPFGQTGAVVSGGTIYLINCAVFIEIACGFVVMCVAFLKEVTE